MHVCMYITTGYNDLGLVFPEFAIRAVALCLGPYGVPGGRAVSYERGTSVEGYLAHKKTPPPRTLR